MPGPWEYEPSTDEILSPDGGIAEMTWPGRTRTSAEFIAHARTDVTALLDALDEAERRLTLAHEVGNEVGERCARAEAEVERTRAERDFEERRADGLAAELAALRGRIEGLADEIERTGVTCACGHYVGGEHNGNGCYAVITYTPLVRCSCTLTDGQDEDAIVASRIRALLADEREGAGRCQAVHVVEPSRFHDNAGTFHCALPAGHPWITAHTDFDGYTWRDRAPEDTPTDPKEA